MISAEVICDSSFGDNRVTTFVLEYPRYIHAELMTHRVFSRNGASSRAIPIEKVIELVQSNTVMPMWTANQSGMQGKTITDGQSINRLNSLWVAAATNAIASARQLLHAGAHKQNVNRLLEPFQHIRVIVTATDYDNFFALRDHPDAQPEIRQLAREMKLAMAASRPWRMQKDDWHIPYIERTRIDDRTAYSCDGKQLSLKEAYMISASCCAQVSYRKNDTTLEKAIAIFDRLITSKPIHASPMEHQCCPDLANAQVGNLTGFVQLRHVLGAFNV